MLGWWLLATARILALVMTAPWLGSRSIPIWIRVSIGVAASVCILPTAPANLASVALDETIYPSLFREIAVGIALGVALSALVLSAELVGQVAGQMAGLQWIDAMESGEESSPLGRLMQWIAIVLFLVLQGPERLMAAVMDSCQSIPIGSTELIQWPAAQWLFEILRQSLWLALRGVGPLVAVVLATHVAVGVLSRIAPQIGLFQAGLSVSLSTFWLAMVLVVSGAGWIYDAEISAWLDDLQNTIRALTLSPESTVNTETILSNIESQGNRP